MTDLRIVHVLGQRPEMTGSGIYLEALIRESRKHGITCYRIAGIPAGSQPSPVDQSSVEGDFVFLNRSKGVPWLLRSLMKITDRDWHLHVAGGGNGPEYDMCIDLIRQLGDRVTLHGYDSHCRLAEIMKQAHIQVLPSFFEGLPLFLFEGLASGCRVITTELPGFHEIFGEAREDTVRLISLPPLETIDRPYQKDEARLIDALSQSLLEMIATARRFPEVDDLQAEKIVSNYTWSRIFERTLSIYGTVVSN